MAKFKVKEKEKDVFSIKDDEKEDRLKVLKDDKLPQFKVQQYPSGKLFYPKDLDVFYKPYTWSDVKLLNSGEFSTKELWKFILDGIIVQSNSKFTSEDLTLSDFFYISFLRKRSSVGDGAFKVPVVCSNFETPEKLCLHKNKFIINEGKDVGFEEMDITKEHVPINIMFNDEKLEIKPLTVKKTLELLDKNLYEDNVALLSALVQNKEIDEIYPLFKTLSVEEGEALEDLSLKLYHGLAKITRECEKCKKEIVIELDAGGTIIKPFRAGEDHGRLRICFGSKRESTIE